MTTQNTNLLSERTIEEWRDVVGWEGIYAISNQGRVRRVAGGWRCRPPGLRHGVIGPTGYPEVGLQQGPRKLKHAKIHHLVLKAFMGIDPNPERDKCNHKNGIKTDNRLENLEWVTHTENMHHSRDVLKQRWDRGEETHSAKLTEREVKAIRWLRSCSNISVIRIGQIFGITRGSVYAILHSRTWKHVQDIDYVANPI